MSKTEYEEPIIDVLTDVTHQGARSTVHYDARYAQNLRLSGYWDINTPILITFPNINTIQIDGTQENSFSRTLQRRTGPQTFRYIGDFTETGTPHFYNAVTFSTRRGLR